MSQMSPMSNASFILRNDWQGPGCSQVHLRSHFIMNGVCVRWRGWVDLERLDGVGCLEFDEEKALVSSIFLLNNSLMLSPQTILIYNA